MWTRGTRRPAGKLEGPGKGVGGRSRAGTKRPGSGKGGGGGGAGRAGAAPLPFVPAPVGPAGARRGFCWGRSRRERSPVGGKGSAGPLGTGGRWATGGASPTAARDEAGRARDAPSAWGRCARGAAGGAHGQRAAPPGGGRAAGRRPRPVPAAPGAPGAGTGGGPGAGGSAGRRAAAAARGAVGGEGGVRPGAAPALAAEVPSGSGAMHLLKRSRRWNVKHAGHPHRDPRAMGALAAASPDFHRAWGVLRGATLVAPVVCVQLRGEAGSSAPQNPLFYGILVWKVLILQPERNWC